MRPEQGASPDQRRADAPLVSVIMSNFNGAACLEPAIRSVLGQSHSRLELIVIDDASKDTSRDILGRLAAADHRLRLVFLATNKGPAVARNAGLDAARGDWVAIVDADDLLHPRRFARLLSAADRMHATAVADDLLSFGNAGTAGQMLLQGSRLEHGPGFLDLADLIRSDSVSSGLSSLGYLKPMIRRDVLGTLRYDETLRVGEDFDLYCRLVMRGMRMLVVPDPTYLYRRHSASISHRLSPVVLANLAAAHDNLAKQALDACPDDGDLAAELTRRGMRLKRALRYQHLVADITAGRLWDGLRKVFRSPALMTDLAHSVTDRWRRRIGAAHGTPSAHPRTVVVAAADRVGSVTAPAGAARVPVGPAPDAGAQNWRARRAMAWQLAALAGRGPVDVIAAGDAGLDGLGYLPAWRSLRQVPDQDNSDGATARDGALGALSGAGA